MSAPKVLLVEDDSSIARFVQMALEELPIELVTCANVPDAMRARPALTGYSGCCKSLCTKAEFRWRYSARA